MHHLVVLTAQNHGLPPSSPAISDVVAGVRGNPFRLAGLATSRKILTPSPIPGHALLPRQCCDFSGLTIRIEGRGDITALGRLISVHE